MRIYQSVKKLKTIFTVTAVIALLLLTNEVKAQNKREFRGVWIQCVNGQYLGKTTEQIQNMLMSQLDELQKDGVNAVIFQVRAECDALYERSWSLGVAISQVYKEKRPSLTGIHCSGWWSSVIREAWNYMLGLILIALSMEQPPRDN